VSPTAAFLFHVALPEDLAEAERTGTYRMSTRGLTVEEVGFVHLSYEHQWRGVIDRCYPDRTDAVVLVLDPAALDGEVVDEEGQAGGETFPHLYGTFTLDAVVARIDPASGD
jgi:glutathione S-transferase